MTLSLSECPACLRKVDRLERIDLWGQKEPVSRCADCLKIAWEVIGNESSVAANS